ncbi:MAG: hypothetical protein LBN27_05710 [Prevotellaceae bacterium]|jgi:hypothetical protein|nr:hypothetical protein [Prevotellaceae bacterium]
MEKFITKKRKILRNIFRGLSLTSIAFVFQACYGIERDFGNDILVEGVVTTRGNKPIEGIKVSYDNSLQYELTDSEGKYSFYTYKAELNMKFEDIDSIQNGLFLPQEMLVHITANRVKLNVKLDAAP